jgi:hypothetical protein
MLSANSSGPAPQHFLEYSIITCADRLSQPRVRRAQGFVAEWSKATHSKCVLFGGESSNLSETGPFLTSDLMW